MGGGGGREAIMGKAPILSINNYHKPKWQIQVVNGDSTRCDGSVVLIDFDE